MATATANSYTPSLKEGARIQLEKSSHEENGHFGVILLALPNPSRLAQHQWYDVRFDNGRYGRFQERYLKTVAQDGSRNPQTDRNAEPAA